MKVDGMFRKFKIDHYTAEYDGHCLWIASGFGHFRDWESRFTKPILSSLGRCARRRIWKELQRELRRRSLGNIANLTSGSRRHD